MVVHIKFIRDDSKIFCSSPFGSLTLKWIDEKPTLNKDYHVELEINKTLFWNKDISLSEINDFTINDENGTIVIIGQLESVEDDGYTVLRVGEDIIPVITKGDPYIIGSMIKITVDTIFAYPVSY